MITTPTTINYHITYHAWLREILKRNEEVFSVETPQSLQQIIFLLQQRGAIWEHTFQNTKTLCFAVNHTLCKNMETVVHHGDTISIFPPFTGG